MTFPPAHYPFAQTLSRDDIAKLTTVGVIGAGVSGRAATRLLQLVCPEDTKIIVVDDRFKTGKDELGLGGVERTGNLDDLAGAKPELVVVSPGVAGDHAVYQLGIPHVLSEIDLAYIVCPMPIIGVTGTNGKSTVTQLIADMGESLGLGSVAGGNIGLAAAELAARQIEAQRQAKMPGDPSKTHPQASALWILELSSYQLEQSRYLRLEGAVFTSFSEDHQERHKNLANYFLAKWEIINRLSTGGFVVIHNETWRDIGRLLLGPEGNRSGKNWPETLTGFSLRHDLHYHLISDGEDLNATLDFEEVLYHGSTRPSLSKYFLTKNPSAVLKDEAGEEVQDLGQPFCLYHHNLGNAALATLTIRSAVAANSKSAARGAAHKKIEVTFDQSKVAEVIHKFKGLAYRFQALCETPNLSIINDSKSTNLESLETAIGSIATGKIVLLVGGVSGSPSYRNLNHYHDKLKWVLCFGQDGDKIYKELNSIPRKCYSPSLAAATSRAIEQIDKHTSSATATEKLVVLFSPGCKSFDEFSDFVERGAYFERAIKDAKGYATWQSTWTGP